LDLYKQHLAIGIGQSTLSRGIDGGSFYAATQKWGVISVAERGRRIRPGSILALRPDDVCQTGLPFPDSFDLPPELHRSRSEKFFKYPIPVWSPGGNILERFKETNCYEARGIIICTVK
jgi:hypothetical protein